MSKEYDLILKSISTCQLALINSKEILEQTSTNITSFEIMNLIAESKELTKLASSLQNLLTSKKI